MNRERLKTLILWILVITSIVLTQQLWFPSLIKTLRAGDKVNKISHAAVIEERKSIITPNRIIASFGAGDRKKNYYTILSSNMNFVWEQSKNILKDYFLEDSEITLVKHDVYIQANTKKSIELEFGDNIPTILVSSIFDTLDNKVIRDIKEIKKILIPASNQGIIYIMDNSKNNIYEVKLSNYKKDDTLVKFIDGLKNTKYIKYHPIYSLFSELDENNTIMPINYTLDTKQVFVQSEIDINNEIRLIEQSKSFFDDKFDFVKTIKETSGAVVYIYGYGEKSVRINNKGALEYNEEIGNISSTDILTSLDTAVDFIYKNGGFPKNTYLKHIQTVTNGKNKGYRFSFEYTIGGFPVKFNGNKTENPIEIEVYGNQVKTYSNLVRKVMNMEGVNPEQKILYFPNIIERNIEYLKSQYFDNENQSVEQIDEEEKTLQMLKDIEEVRLVYFDTVEKQRIQLLKPSWMIKIRNNIYYFDGYTGRLINSGTLN